MAYSISTSNVTISHFGATDVTDGVGSTKYNIFFDASLVNYGPALMFEYRIRQKIDSGEYILGYINTENSCIQSGIENQYVVSVPSQNSDYDSDRLISMRVYIGYTDKGSCETTPWSNELQIHNAPETRQIASTYFDSSGDLHDLYVFLDDSAIAERYSNDPSLNYLVAYYYEDPSNNIIWKVSDLLQSKIVTLKGDVKPMLTIKDFGIVSSDTQIIHVAVYTVWQFQVDEKNYYAVSHISNTKQSNPADRYSTPTLDDVLYNVYENGVQSMKLTWSPPENAGIPTFTVDHYIVEKKINQSSTWEVINSSISDNIYEYTYDLIVPEKVNDTYFEFRLIAVSTTGTPSPPSNIQSQTYFEYATEPLNLTISDNITVAENWVGMTVNFDNPSNIGSAGNNTRQFLITNDTNDYFVEVPYDANASPYSIDISFNLEANTGYIYVIMQNQDTNSNSLLDGAAIASTSYVAGGVVLDDVTYLVYTDMSSQLMELRWSNTIINGWDVSYTVDVMDGTNNPKIDGILTNSYDFDTSSYPLDTSFLFTVIGHYNDGSNTYSFTSNMKTQNKYVYSEKPSNVLLGWSVADEVNENMDLRLEFLNPASIGSGDPTKFTVTVYDGSTNPISTKQVNYSNVLNNKYVVSFINISYSYSGNIKINLSTKDTNNNNIILDGYVASIDYQTSSVPIIKDITYDSTKPLTFKVISSILVTGVQMNVAYKNSQGNLAVAGQKDLPVDEATDRLNELVISQVPYPTGDVYIYEYTISRSNILDVSVVSQGFILITAANNSGISTKI